MSVKLPAFAFVTLPLLFGGCVGTTASPPISTATMSVTDSEEFIRMATSSNLLEIESSRLALQQSHDPEVRRFATQMIRDHSQASRRMAAVVRRAGLPAAPTELSSRHQAMLDQLAASTPDGFDSAYVALQARAHEEAIALFSSYAQSGDDPRLVGFARRTLPTLQRHAAHLPRLSSSAS